MDTHEYTEWMTHLPEKLLDLPLNQLAIPGSHDSATSTLNTDLKVGPDESKYIRWLGKIKFTKRIIYKWAKAQELTITQQMEAGIRYFDLRVATYPDSHELRLLHGLYSLKLEDCLLEIQKFLNLHEKEVVLLDFNHFYGSDANHSLTPDEKREFKDLVVGVLGKKLCPFQDEFKAKITLNQLWKQNYQVLAFCENKYPDLDDQKRLWPGTAIPSPWPNVENAGLLIDRLQANINKERDMSIFSVTQGVLTPKTGTIVWHCYSTLKKVMSDPCNVKFTKWLSEQKAGENGINICIMDFVETQNYIPIMMKMNKELAESL